MPGRSIGWDLHTPDDPAAAPSHWQRYGFDGAGRLNAVSSPAGEYSYTYVEQSHLLASVTGPVHTVTNSYESGRDAMTSKTNAAASGTVSRLSARYDALGLSVLRTELSSGDGMEMVGVETDDNPLAPQAGLLQDASGGHGPMSTPLESPLQSPLLPSTSLTERDARFEGATPGAPDQKLEEESFAFLYDGIGNRLTAQKGTDTTSYTPNALNQYTDIGGMQPVHDADGNLFSDGKNRYHWDAENRLILVEPIVPTEGSKRLEFKYDYIGRRVSKQVWTHTGGSWTDESTTAFVYDSWNLIEEIATSSQTASINHYTWGLDLSLSLQGAGGVGGLLALSVAEGLALSHVEGLASPQTFHYTFDLNGNVSEVLDSTGTIAAHYEYGPFGETLVEYNSAGLGTAVASFRFSTKYYDAELKTLYYGYRFYDPSHGRWLNRDPIEESGGLNLYGFVGNDAVNRWDIWGMAISGIKVGDIVPFSDYNKHRLDAIRNAKSAPAPQQIKGILCCIEEGREFLAYLDTHAEVYCAEKEHLFEQQNGAFKYLGEFSISASGYSQDGRVFLNPNQKPNGAYQKFRTGKGGANANSWWQFLAYTIYHEILHGSYKKHAVLDPDLTYSNLDEEAEIRLQVELWAIRMGFPETQPGYRNHKTNTPKPNTIWKDITDNRSGKKRYLGPKTVGFPANLTKLTNFSCVDAAS